jgi:hypothetical protein
MSDQASSGFLLSFMIERSRASSPEWPPWRARLGLRRTCGADLTAIAEDGIALREIAEAVGRLVSVPAVSKTPEEAASHFGFLAYFVSADFQASSTKTKQALGWNPTGPGLIADLRAAR